MTSSVQPQVKPSFDQKIGNQLLDRFFHYTGFQNLDISHVEQDAQRNGFGICIDMDSEVIQDDDDINLESFGDELDAPPGFRDRNHPIQVEDEEDEDKDDDNDVGGGAFGSHDDIDFNFLLNK